MHGQIIPTHPNTTQPIPLWQYARTENALETANSWKQLKRQVRGPSAVVNYPYRRHHHNPFSSVVGRVAWPSLSQLVFMSAKWEQASDTITSEDHEGGLTFFSASRPLHEIYSYPLTVSSISSWGPNQTQVMKDEGESEGLCLLASAISKG